MKNYMLIIIIFIFSSCGKDYLNVLPEDQITSVSFWKTKDDFDLALSGIYKVMKEQYFYGLGPGFEGFTPNGYFWNNVNQLIGNGSFHAGTAGPITGRWTSCYKLIYRANAFLSNLDKNEILNESDKILYSGEVHFLRGIAYSLLAQSYGGVPIITEPIGVVEARELKRASLEDTWNQAINDFNEAIESLNVTPIQTGRATKGAALGFKMRAFLYQNKYNDVLEVIKLIEDLDKYSLFPSFQGLFLRVNQNNSEVLFDVQNIGDPSGEGGYRFSYYLPYVPASGGWCAPTQDLVDQFEMIDGGEINPDSPYDGRDPRLDFTIILPGTLFGGNEFNSVAQNHIGQPIQNFSMRKYSDVLVGGEIPAPDDADLNFIVLRFADVLLAKAEALIETSQDLDEAVNLINKIRTFRDDVKIYKLPNGLSQEKLREHLRHERRVEFALEGIIYWNDIKRWEIGPEIYPQKIFGSNGELVEIRYPEGYILPKDKYWPIPDSEISLNANLKQNPGW